MRHNFLIISSLVFILVSSANGQLRSNIFLLTQCADSSVMDLADGQFKNQKIFIEYNSKIGESYFLNILQTKLTDSGAEIVFNRSKSDQAIIYNLLDASIEYEKVLKEGFLDDYFVERKTIYEGKYKVIKNYQLIEEKDFNYSLVDTVKYDQVRSIENFDYDFAKGKIPDESFWDSFLEPFVAIGTIVLTIILLFTVRSN